jgi:S-DNA-T family DNA segregation ATPase FtsK/SpoIIIE
MRPGEAFIPQRQPGSEHQGCIWRLVAEARWLAFAVLGLYLLLILFTHSMSDPGWSRTSDAVTLINKGGRLGALLADILYYIFGYSVWWLVLMLFRQIMTGLRRLQAWLRAEPLVSRSRSALAISCAGFLLLLLSSAALEALRFGGPHTALPYSSGGVVGEALALRVLDWLGPAGGTLSLLAVFFIGFSLYFHISWLSVAEKLGEWIEFAIRFIKQRQEAEEDRLAGEVAAAEREKIVEQEVAHQHKPIHIESPVLDIPVSKRVLKEKQKPLFSELPDSPLPTVDLLDPAPLTQEFVGIDTLEFTSRLIEKKLKDFGVEATVVAAYPGPVITRYEIEPAVGVKGAQIVNLGKDLARSLSLTSIRVVETIPGKNYMGLELPNPKRQSVRLSEILGSEVYNDAPSLLTLALGKDIAGKPVVADLAKMPHLLVAGTTGSGKSVGINAMILSLLYKATPEQVRLILIDPKMLEMSVYEGIPHLLAPVVTDMRQAGHALNWAVAEMERRYKLMSKLGVRNLNGYNMKIADAEALGEPFPNPFSLTPDQPEPLQKLPLIVIVIDELADLMMVVGKKVEELIARIAQKARAAGIHLILATQRPSVDVITGLIKANVPTRISFQVSSKIDSRTILDQQGAEALLGMGDMLFMASGTGLPVRVHGAYVADDEVHRVVQFLKRQGEPDYVEGILEGGVESDFAVDLGPGSGVSAEGTEGDDLYDQAVAIVLKNRRASISLVQRHLRIGYNRAARLLEQMEQSGVVSAMQSNGNREILVPLSGNE